MRVLPANSVGVSGFRCLRCVFWGYELSLGASLHQSRLLEVRIRWKVLGFFMLDFGRVFGNVVLSVFCCLSQKIRTETTRIFWGIEGLDFFHLRDQSEDICETKGITVLNTELCHHAIFPEAGWLEGVSTRFWCQDCLLCSLVLWGRLSCCLLYGCWTKNRGGPPKSSHV